jgi:hypothetical protein
MPQISAYLTDAEHARFAAYSAQFGLDAGSLAYLLFRRELRLGRLPVLVAQPRLGGGAARMKVTAHGATSDLKARLQVHARSSGLSLSRACALILNAEFSDRAFEHFVNGGDSE